MTRLLVWNVNNFSEAKVYDNSSVAAFDQSLDRRLYMMSNVFVPNIPDIFVIVEVYQRVREVTFQGALIHGRAAKGARMLLDRIRFWSANNQWCLVPPVALGGQGFQEGVAVYFDSTKLQFIGPYVWGTDYRTRGRTAPIEGACPRDASYRPHGYDLGEYNGPHPYVDPWDGCLRGDRNHDGISEDCFAGQWEYFDGDRRRGFTEDYHRPPFLTRFIDLTAGANNRVINLYSVHTSPNIAIFAFDKIRELVSAAPPGDNEVNVVAGDFNVDPFAFFLWGNPYFLFTGYGMAIDALDGTGAAVANRQPFCMTHFLPVNKATPYNNKTGVTDPRHNVYPRFGYMGSMGGRKFLTPVNTGAIDNILTCYGTHAARPAATRATIVNTVVGAPYTALAPLPAGVPTSVAGSLVYPSTLANAVPVPAGVTEPASRPDVELFRFVQWDNFGKIHSVSDHLPIIADV